jgi:integrase
MRKRARGKIRGAYRQQTGGTFMIEWQRKGVLPIKRASGTNDPNRLVAIKQMLNELYASGKIEVLEEIATGVIRPINAYNLFKAGKLKTATSTVGFRSPRDEITAYLDSSDAKPSTIYGYRSLLKLFLEDVDPKTLADIPKALSTIRDLRQKAGQNRRSFDTLRSMLMGFMAKTKGLGNTSQLYLDTKAVLPFKVRPRKLVPLKVAQYLELHRQLKPVSCRNAAEALVFTGMRKSEYFKNQYKDMGDYILIDGTKTPGSRREVPKLIDIQPGKNESGLRRELIRVGTAMTLTLSPHSFRYTYRNWLEEAGIPVTRCELYMGHESGSSDDVYTWVERITYAEEDAIKFEKWYNAEVKKAKNPKKTPKRRVKLARG